MTKHKGEHIREVWDWRLSNACPMLFNGGETWVVKITANDGSGVLEEHDTGYPTGEYNPHDKKAVAKCYDWLRTVRDKYSRDHIELRKPVVALINEANREVNAIMGDAIAAKAAGDVDAVNELQSTYLRVLDERNLLIKRAIKEMNEKIGGAK